MGYEGLVLGNFPEAVTAATEGAVRIFLFLFCRGSDRKRRGEALRSSDCFRVLWYRVYYSRPPYFHVALMFGVRLYSRGSQTSKSSTARSPR